MALSKEKTEQLLQELEKKQARDMKSKDVDKLTSHYHPDAVIVHKGVKAFYGRDEIKECMKLWYGGDSTEIPESKPLYSTSSADGEYLIRRGTFPCGGKDFPYEVIYKKVNGEYLAYHDEYEFPSS